LVVGPGVVGDLDLDAGILLLELSRVVLDGIERVVPDGELQRDVLGLRRGRARPELGSQQRGDRRQTPFPHRLLHGSRRSRRAASAAALLSVEPSRIYRSAIESYTNMQWEAVALEPDAEMAGNDGRRRGADSGCGR